MHGDRIVSVGGGELAVGAATPGIVRELAFDIDGATLMRARAEPGAATGWHHHGVLAVVGEGPLVVNVEGPEG